MDEKLRFGDAPDPAANEIDRLATFILEHMSYEIGDESAVDVAIRVLGQREATRKAAEPFFRVMADAEDFLAQTAARLKHLDDVYAVLGVKWGEDPFARIAELSKLPARAYLPVFADISAERVAQDAEWGGPGHDDEHNVGQWADMIREKLSMADNMERLAMQGSSIESRTYAADRARRRLIQVAALAVAALESFDRKYATAEASHA